MLFIGIIILFYLFLYVLVPKGNLGHEILYFPIFWVRHIFSSRPKMEEEKIAYGQYKHQYFLKLKPVGPITKKEFIVYFHGGSWRFGRPRFFRLNAGYFVRRGYQVILPSHRHPPRYKYTDLREDLNLLLEKITEIASDQELFDFKIIVGGMSSGGHLATMIVFDQEALQEIPFPNSRIAGLFINAAPLNFNLMPDHFVLKDLAGPRFGELFQIANPANYLNPEVRTPILHFHGTKDGMVPYDSVLPFKSELESYHPDYQFYTIENGNHYQVLRWLYQDKEERKILDQWLKRISRNIENNAN